MENEEMTNDAAVAYKFQDRLADGTWQDQYWHRLPPWEHRNPEPLYSATTVAELRAEVERLRVQLAGCGVIAMSNTRDSLAEQMPPTSAYGWSPSLVEVHDAVFREIQNRERADAAERRVAELEAGLASARRAIGDHHAPNDCYATGPLTGDEFLDLVQCPACAFFDQYAALTKESK